MRFADTVGTSRIIAEHVALQSLDDDTIHQSIFFNSSMYFFRTHPKNVFNSFISESELKTMSLQNHDDDQKWRIPIGLSYNALKIILTSIYQKQGDQKIISLGDIVKTSGLTRRIVATNLRFFQSIDLVTGTSKSGFRFTPLGTQFAKALIQKNDEEIKNTIKTIVSKTHIKDIVDYISVRGESISLSQLYGFIKAESRVPDGNMPGNMLPHTSQEPERYSLC